MKLALTLALPLMFAGCKAPDSERQPATHTGGGYQWYLGAVEMHGTNVPVANVTVRAVSPSKEKGK